ncbi:MAG: rod shape-determining protein MreC [Chthoniobacterales bacterium]
MNRARFLLLSAIIVAALTFSFLGTNSLKTLKSGLISCLSPIIRSRLFVEKKIGRIGQNLMTLDQLDTEYHRLLLENKNLHVENDALRGLQEENNKLRETLGYSKRSAFKLLPAAVVAHDSSIWWNTIKINRGSHDGVEIDRAVITDRGLVGKTISVTPDLSVVLLITDENCKVAAKVEGTHEQGIENGPRVPTGELQLTFLNKLADLQPGQKVYTAGVSGGIFPSGIQIGTVKSFQIHELDGEAMLEPAADLNNLEDVFVIVGAK